MRDWIDIQHQQHQYVLPPEFQQILAPRNLGSSAAPPGSSGHFLGISPPAGASQQQQHFQNHLQFFHQQQMPLKHLLGRGDFLDRGRPDQECEHGGGGEEVAEEDDGWSSDEARALIRVRRDLDSSFRSLSSPQLHLWDEISRRLGAMGFIKDGKTCKEKFDRMSRHYKRTRDPGAGSTSERLIEELDAFYGNNNNILSMVQAQKNIATTTGSDSPEKNQAPNNTPAAVVTANGVGGASAQAPEQNDDLSDRPEEDEDQQQFDVNSSSESSAEYDEPSQETNNRSLKKRRRKSWKARMAFFENLVRKFIEKQEEMQQRFLEQLDKREQERCRRDEVWRKQETARMSREYELRVEEYARRTNYENAFSSALQKASGNLPSNSNAANMAMNNQNNNGGALALSQGPIPSPYSNESNEEHHQVQQLQLQVNHQGGDSMNKRWPKGEVQALIQLRAAMEAKFQEVGPKGPFWEEISAGLACQGYIRSSKRCKEKWENINKYYRKTSNKKRPENTKTCPYFQELDLLYQKGVIRGGNTGALVIHNNNSSKVEETTDENREESGSREAEAEVLSIMPAAAESLQKPNAARGVLFGNSGENCVHNTESTSCGAHEKQQVGNKMKPVAQKRSWSECENGGGLGLSFEALQQGAELMMCSNKSLKFSTEHMVGGSENQHHQLQIQQQQQMNHVVSQLQQEMNHHHHHHRSRELMLERQSQEFQEVESSATNLVDGFGLVRARAV